MQKIRIKIKAYDSKIIDNAAEQIITTASRTGAKTAGPIPLPTNRSVYAVHRSPFKFGNAMDHFEMRTHKRLIEIIEPNQKTIDALTHLQLAAGVSIEIK
ncbi:30S ribosomal protein S10 [Candidatus Dojkabacteria bacterium]|uniref:Small ribosomal subunit protein uS10 n=1 Tax=Candidatus Dojkabacteria bacterium TaxID=2099670 RepID=A0A955L848_9BACT|nr:30S ribosomal protein S10 [Candidatus Dojkabacteria bacterium]